MTTCEACDNRGWTLRDARIHVCGCGTYDPPKWVRRGDAACVIPHRSDPDRPRRAHVGYACAGHHVKIGEMLASLPNLYDDLEAALTRPERHYDKADEGKRRNSAKGAGVSLNGKVVDLRDEIHAELVRMVRWVIEERQLHAWPADTEAAMTGWLAAHVDWMCEQPDVDDTHDNLDRLTRAAHSLAFPRGRHQVVCGRCLEVTACDVESRKPLQCPGNLVVEWTEPADLEPEGIDCTVCGKTWPHRYWSDLGDRLRESA